MHGIVTFVGLSQEGDLVSCYLWYLIYLLLIFCMPESWWHSIAGCLTHTLDNWCQKRLHDFYATGFSCILFSFFLYVLIKKTDFPISSIETTYDVLPRLSKIKFDSGVIDELLFPGMPQEFRFSNGMMSLEYVKAVQESVYEHIRVVREGQLRIVFTPDLKVKS